ncbi:MAG: flavodoxin [Candidatus Altiarchaeota archaeon]|nr:flavodoxin [Candidatus Altiarchaeota archaeon]
MSEIAIVYWSGTGNTEAMAEAIKEGIESNGVDVSLKPVEEARLEDIKDAKIVVLGSPAMGAEELAEEMEPIVSQMEKEGMNDKVAGAFGSYDWGDGQWMSDFVDRLRRDGFKVVGDGLIIHLTPCEEGLERCREYGRMILKEIK